MKALSRQHTLKAVSCNNPIEDDIDYVVCTASEILSKLKECITQTRKEKYKSCREVNRIR